MEKTLLSKWELRFVEEAEAKSKWSKDPSTKIGAVIVSDEDKQILSSGYNGLARGVNDNDITRLHTRPEKYFWFGHGERNAIYNAARYGIRTKGATMYLNCSTPCTGCAIAIINSGIIKVVCKMANTTSNPGKWDEEAAKSRTMFEEAGVEVVYY